MWSPLLSWLNFNQWIQAEEKGNFNSLHTKALLPWGEGVAFEKGVPLHPHDSWHRNFHQLSEKPQVTTTTAMPSVTPAQVGVDFRPFFFRRWRLRNEHQWFGMMVWHGLNLPHFLIKQKEFKQRINNTNFERQRCKKTIHTVDGSEIWRSPVEGRVVYHIIYSVSIPPQGVGIGISEPSTVAFGSFSTNCATAPKGPKQSRQWTNHRSHTLQGEPQG